MTDSNCIFCAIATGKAPAVIIHEDADTLAFLDIRPASEGHCLVIPRRHADDVWSLSSEDAKAVAETVRQVAVRLRRVLMPDGLRVAQFNGAIAGQTVFHYHVHLIPMKRGDERLDHGRHAASPEALADLAERLKAAR